MLTLDAQRIQTILIVPISVLQILWYTLMGTNGVVVEWGSP
jgi:hypothetical protein